MNTYQDKELGLFNLHTNIRATNISFRLRRNAFYVTLPYGTSANKFISAIDELRPKLRKMKEEADAQLIGLDYRIDTELVHLSLTLGLPDDPRYYIKHPDKSTSLIICPTKTKFHESSTQDLIVNVIEKDLQKRALLYLPKHIKELSVRHKLPYKDVRIHQCHRKWGSCDSHKSIVLSYYLMALHSKFIDYVILHELCHTLEMNHNEHFWRLLNEHTEGEALALREGINKEGKLHPYISII